ncbi:MAG: hypothetical protein ABL932_05255 [Terricaulis sp.]
MLKISTQDVRVIAEREVGNENRLQSLCVREVIRKIQPTLTLRSAPIADGKEAREIRVSCAIFRIDDEVRRSIAKYKPSPDDYVDVALANLAHRLGFNVRAYDPCEGVAISDTNSG